MVKPIKPVALEDRKKRFEEILNDIEEAIESEKAAELKPFEEERKKLDENEIMKKAKKDGKINETHSKCDDLFREKEIKKNSE